MRNGMFVSAARVQSSPLVKSDGKARFDTGTGSPPSRSKGN